MKYFVRMRESGAKPIECDEDYARELYKLSAWGGTFAKMNAMEKFAKGKYAVDVHYEIWGEEISEKNLFERILKGEVQSGIYRLQEEL